ncbi:phytoene desaturase family protein [Christiangramia sabulilitoris]|uniref:Pyridine nucleotide-disulfide oxidoreductase domain-containing protein 2 n=1 Tax=Christiangramia sabulilitoris TaxID=2583991 RepID=A0A550HZB3_9FLAO|nr:NAD(P)/FAD-dependent oxidoreductase [Christiangramia sabulilitoris]TRO64061.1 NAD(P)/FAD-dependent oxidoreductase [Christiangramia sabulilitoris]
MSELFDAVITGSGPNGISTAIYLQKKGLKTVIFEQASTPGGSVRTEELTLAGFKHDIGSAIHPMAYASPFLRKLPLEDHGLKWIFPEIPYTQVLSDGGAVACYRDIKATADQLGEDAASYIHLFESLTKSWPKIEKDLLGPLTWPDDPVEFLKFGLRAFPSARFFANHNFKKEKTKLFFYGAAAHSTLPLTNIASASFGLVLSIMAHKYGWPFPEGGASGLTNALISYYKSLGGEIRLNEKISDLKQLPESDSYLFDLTPRQILSIKNIELSSTYKKRLQKYNYGAGVFKIDWALEEPIPWLNDKCRRSGTVHIGYSTEEIEKSESDIHANRLNNIPYVLLAQNSVFDTTRAPVGKQTAWAYCHVPNGNIADQTAAIEDQIEKAAPGFRKIILARNTYTTRQLEHFNPNIIGGDINGGKQDITQLFTRPVAKLDPYATSNPKIFICSSSTPPGGGVHGMCGYHAARSAFKFLDKSKRI